jgi:hypothetical protein
MPTRRPAPAPLPYHAVQVGDNVTPYNNFERTFFVLVLIAGTFFYSAVVGQMATLVATMNVAVNRHGWVRK